MAVCDTQWCICSLRVLIACPCSVCRSSVGFVVTQPGLAQRPVETVMALKSSVLPQAGTQRPRVLQLKEQLSQK